MTELAFKEVPAKKKAVKKDFEAPKQFGPTYNGHYPSEMRTQLWPLCCGARIISGFKQVGTLSEDELVEQITKIIDDSIPDHQVFHFEEMKPNLIFLTLNAGQLKSPKIMRAIKRCGFMKFAEAKPRGNTQGFFVKDLSNSWTPINED